MLLVPCWSGDRLDHWIHTVSCCSRALAFTTRPLHLIYNTITETWLGERKKNGRGGGTPRVFSSRINLQSGFDIRWMQRFRAQINECITNKTPNTLVKKTTKKQCKKEHRQKWKTALNSSTGFVLPQILIFISVRIKGAVCPFFKRF